MISFTDFGDDTAPELKLKLHPALIALPQRWVQPGRLDTSGPPPEAALNLRTQDARLMFTTRMPYSPADGFHEKRSEFAADLWQSNVIECFLANPVSGRYLEIHLSPSARWWSCTFSALRLREQEHGHPLPLSKVRHFLHPGGGMWEACVEVPAEVVCSLLEVRQVTDLRGNLCALVYPEAGDRLYYSLAPLPGEKPDFHQPPAWLPLTR